MWERFLHGLRLPGSDLDIKVKEILEDFICGVKELEKIGLRARRNHFCQTTRQDERVEDPAQTRRMYPANSEKIQTRKKYERTPEMKRVNWEAVKFQIGGGKCQRYQKQSGKSVIK